MKRRILSMVLAAAILFTSVDITAFAQPSINISDETVTEEAETQETEEETEISTTEETETQETTEDLESDDDTISLPSDTNQNTLSENTPIVNPKVSVEANNSFGTLVAEVFEDGIEEQAENNGYNILSIEIEDTEAIVSYETLEDCSIVVGIYDESGEKMVASGYCEVSKESRIASIKINTESMPEYFLVKGYMVDSTNLRPLCELYESPMYTQEMQDFLSKTVNDFEEDKVLNLDENIANNFAVFSSDTILFRQNSDTNIITESDSKNKKYEFENPDDSMKELQVGDIFAYIYDDNDTLIVKVADITTEENSLIITGQDTTLEEVFDYVKIDSDSVLDENTAIDDSTCGEGVTYNGLVEPDKESEEAQAYAFEPINIDKTSGLYGSYSIDKSWGEDDFSGKIEGIAELGFENTLKIYISLSYKYFELKIDYSIKTKLLIKGTIKDSLPLAEFGFVPVAGITIKFTPSIVLEGTAKIELTGKVSGTVGISFASDTGGRNLTTLPKFKADLKGEISIFLGISLKPELDVLTEYFIELSLTAKAGVELKGTITLFETTESVQHDCQKCLDGDVLGKLTMSADAKFLNNDNWKLTYKIIDYKKKLYDFYYSFDRNEFGLTTCPYYKYKVSVVVYDTNKTPLSGARITVKDINSTTNSEGKLDFYLSNGEYVITVTDSIQGTIHKRIIIKDGSKKVVLRFGEDEFGDEKIKVGDYVVLGQYLGEDILWRCVDIDENGPLMLSDKILCLKPFDASGVSLNSSHARGNNSRHKRYNRGSAYWADSNIRDWLNSRAKAGEVKFSDGISPVNSAVYYGYDDYADESGFLSADNFTKEELSRIRTVTQKYVLNRVDVEFADGGTEGHSEGLGITDFLLNYDSAYYKYTTDRMFLISLKQLQAVYDNFGDYYKGYITESGAQESERNVSSGEQRFYWLRDSMWNDYVPTHARVVGGFQTGRELDFHWAYDDKGTGVRPAFYLETNGLQWAQGDGSEESPYGIGAGAKVKTQQANYDFENMFSLQTEGNVSLSETNQLRIIDLQANELYNFYVMKNKEADDRLASDNLLFVGQAFADDSGIINVSCELPENSENCDIFAVAFQQIDIGNAQFLVKDLTYNEKEQFAMVSATYNGEQLEEGIDFEIEGEYGVTDIGTYTLSIKGIGLYSGSTEIAYKVLEPKMHTIIFQSNGGTNVPNQEIQENGLVIKPEDPIKEGYYFAGWYFGDTLYDFSIPVTRNILLEAKWEEKEALGDILPEDLPEGGLGAVPDGIWIAGIADKTFTGSSEKQSFRVYDGKKLLKEKTDYTVTYKNNKNAYTYTDEDYAAFEENLQETGKKVKTGTFDPAKAPQVTIKMKGNYSGSRTIYYKIEKADISGDSFTANDLTVTYSGKKQTPAPMLTWNGKALKHGTDFYVPEYENAKKDKTAFTASKTYDLTIVGKGNFAGEIPIKLTISESSKQIAMNKVTVKGIKDLPWTGEQLTQTNFKINYKNDVLSEESGDYTITWGTNTDVGTGTMTLAGTGVDSDGDGYSYIGTKKISFKIIGTAMSKVTVEGVKKEYTYTGTAIKPEPVLTYKANSSAEPVPLTDGVHYTVTYEKNTDKGTASVIFTGLESGGYTGTKKVTFKITPDSIADKKDGETLIEQISVSFTDTENVQNGIYVAPYMKGGAKPEVTVKKADKELELGKDYTVNYANNKKVALYTEKNAPSITIKGKGNYAGSKTVCFSITAKPLSNENGITIVANDKVESTKKNGYRQNFKVLDADGTALGSSDYDAKNATYTLISTQSEGGIVNTENKTLNKDSVVPANSVIQITVPGKGIYAGSSATGTYRILENSHDISKAVIQINNQPYTGKPVLITDQSQFKTDKVYIKIGNETKILTLGEDIEVVPGSYVKNINKGTAKVTFRGINSFGGTKTVSFSIGTRSIGDFWKGIFTKVTGLFN